MGATQKATTRNESTTFNVSNIGLDQQTVNNISQICDIENKSSNLVQIVGSTVNNLDIKQPCCRMLIIELLMVVSCLDPDHPLLTIFQKFIIK